MLPFHRSLSKTVETLGIPEQKRAATSSTVITGLLGSSLKSLDSSLYMLYLKVLNLIAYGTCNSRTVECKDAHTQEM